MERLDKYDNMEKDMKKYLEKNGWHFSKRMYEFAVGNMRNKDDKPINILSKEEIDSKFRQHNIAITYKGYDAPYVYCMAMADFYGSSLPNEMFVLRYVKDYIEDPDGYDEIAFTRYYADTIGSGTPIEWEDVL